MTARVCPVHGEYAADGICRWCEPAPAPAKYSRAACDDVSMFRGVEYDWTRGPEVDMLDALNAPLYADVPPPEKLSEALVGLSERLPPATTYMGAPVVVDPHASSDAPPMLVNWRPPAPRYPLVNYLPPEYDHTEAVIDAETHAAEESRLLAQHAALRWERVARRWATKAKFDGHERTVDGTLSFDNRCAECRRLDHRGNRIAAKEPKP